MSFGRLRALLVSEHSQRVDQLSSCFARLDDGIHQHIGGGVKGIGILEVVFVYFSLPEFIRLCGGFNFLAKNQIDINS